MTPAYMISSTAAEKIAYYQPQARLIVTLRNPLDIAFSSFRWRMQLGLIGQRVTFADALRNDPMIIRDAEVGSNLDPFLQRFPPQQFHYVFFEDIKSKPDFVVAALCRFLGVSPFLPDGLTASVNETKAAKFPLLSQSFRSAVIFAKRMQAGVLIDTLKSTSVGQVVKQAAMATKPNTRQLVITDEAIEIVCDRLLSEIQTLETLTGKDLEHWRKTLGSSHC